MFERIHMLIVGIGASAGGLPAIICGLESYTEAPQNVCFVIIQHLAPDKKSYMLDILQSKTYLPIEVVDKEVTLNPGKVYLAPPGKLLSIVSNKLIPSDIPSHHGPQKSIDFFFKSLSISGLYSSLGVVLSGTGTDGLKGSQDLYEAGAEIFVQDPNEAEFPGMPDAVIKSGFFTKKIKVTELQESISDLINSEEQIQMERKQFHQINERIDSVSELLSQNFNLQLTRL